MIKCSVAGVVATAVFLGLADILARFFAPSASPLVALGNTIVELSPPALQEFAISTFGSSNKLVLFISMAIGGALAAALLGVLAGWRPKVAGVVFSAIGLIFVGLVLRRPDTGWVDVVPTVVGVGLGLAALTALVTTARPHATSFCENEPLPAASRRAFLGLASAGTAVAAVSLTLGRSVQTFVQDAAMAVDRLVLPSPAVRAALIPQSASIGVPGVAPFITGNSEFFRIDTALIVPELNPEEWTLRIHGLVESEVLIDMSELLALPLEEHHITLACVSNPVGGDLLGTATWLGYPVRELLARAGPLPEADMVLSRSSDGFTASTPLEALTDARDSLLAVGMNGEPLPTQHGFPARLVVPGLYGYVSATKWVVELEVTRFDLETAYWTDRGWDERAPVLVSSRIDVPQALETLPAGDVVIAGSAWAQHVGIEAVEVQVDGGDWEPAELASEVSIDTWRQWRYVFSNAEPGRHWVTVRARTADGEVQTGERQDPIPNAATGRHRIDFGVE
ncbi:molybdopterin-dependent oxidoreductase [Nesterenkonia natronophila]|uniref:Oxidoreductase n=1 Tax=Nesterenkonia natronophila TaxID=2174932 RepID=A0A3A4FIK9_9MICC|nr:molybdopterin-dependent oxidoreductase [Nesterenkonia natronophila]RJN32165.1 oxidoreductase [Nesterenkonia natronophila]